MSEQQFKVLFENSQGMLCTHDRRGILLNINTAAANSLGYKTDELIGKNLYDLLHPNEKPLFKRYLLNVFREKVYKGVMTILHKSGHAHSWAYQNTVFEQPDGEEIVIGSAIDITQQAQQERELKKSRQAYKSLVENIPGITYQCKYDADWTLFYISAHIDKITGYTREELLYNKSTSFGELIHPDDIVDVNVAKEKAVKKNTVWETEYRIKHKSGYYRWAYEKGNAVKNEQGEVDYLTGIILDITENKETEIKLDQARFRHQYILEGTHAGTWEWNVQTGETIFNERWVEIAGYTLDELEPVSIDTWMELAHPDDLKESERRLQLCFEKKSEFYEMEARMKHKDGHWVWVLDRGKVISWSDDGKPLMMYGTHQDITNTKNAENELLYNQNLLEALYGLSPIGIALNDYETGTFIDINDKLLEPTGYTREEFFNLSYFDITPKEYFKGEEEALMSMEKTGRYGPFEKEYIRKDGSRYPVLLNGVVVKDLNGRKLIWSFIEDISVKKETERKLYNALSGLKAILNASTQVSIIATDPEGTITHFNKGAENMLGYSAEEVVGKHTPQLIHLDEEIVQRSEFLSEKFGREIDGFDVFIEETKQGTATTSKWMYKRKDGSTYPVLLSVTSIRKDNNITGYLGVAADVSQLEEVKKEIQDITNAVDASSLVSITDNKGNIIKANRQFCEVSGYTEAELLGQNHRIINSVHHDKLFWRDLWETITSGELWKGEIKNRAKDGSEYWVSTIINPITDKNGTITSYLSIRQDITNRKKAEEKNQSLLKITGEQNERLKNFAHIVTHNLRSHSAGIYGMLDLIKMEYPDIYTNEYIQLLEKVGNNLIETIGNLTEIVKQSFVEGEELKEINLKEAVERNINSAVTAVNKETLKVMNEVDDDLKLKVIPAYMDSIIMNFLTNAVKYSSPERESYLKIYSRKKKNYIQINFEDNGLGIDLDKYGEKLFGMYNTFHNHEDSRGVGLFITKNQIETMGGYIEVESEVGNGTTFKVYLPNSEE